MADPRLLVTKTVIFAVPIVRVIGTSAKESEFIINVLIRGLKNIIIGMIPAIAHVHLQLVAAEAVRALAHAPVEKDKMFVRGKAIMTAVSVS